MRLPSTALEMLALCSLTSSLLRGIFSSVTGHLVLVIRCPFHCLLVRYIIFKQRLRSSWHAKEACRFGQPHDHSPQGMVGLRPPLDQASETENAETSFYMPTVTRAGSMYGRCPFEEPKVSFFMLIESPEMTPPGPKATPPAAILDTPGSHLGRP